MIVAGARWLIALRDPEDVHHSSAIAIREEARELPVLLHPLTLAECLVAPARLGVLAAAEAAIRAAVDVIEFDPESPVRVAAIRASHQLRLPDAIVLDTALQHRATAVATFDVRLAAAATSVGLTVLDGTRR